MKRLFISALCSLLLLSTSCSDNDEPGTSPNTIPLNMMVGDPESTVGGSDVYINKSANFTSDDCGIVDAGRKGSLSLNPILSSQIAQDVAVTPGNYYQIIPAEDISTVAKERAFPINTSYYNVYVESWIYDRDNDLTGAKIRYAECFPDDKALPEWDTETVIKLRTNEYSETASYSFAKGTRIDKNYRIYDHHDSVLGDRIDIEINDNSISFRNVAWTPGGRCDVVLLVRHGSLYTRVRLTVESSC